MVENQSYNLLLEGVLLGIYGNWFIGLFEKLSLDMNFPIITMIEWLGFGISISVLVLFFLEVASSRKKWWGSLYLILISVPLFTEMHFQIISKVDFYSVLKLFFYWGFGGALWSLIILLEVRRLRINEVLEKT